MKLSLNFSQSKLQATYQVIYTKLQFIFDSLLRNGFQQMLQCVFIFVLSEIPNKDNGKMEGVATLLQGVSMVSVIGRYTYTGLLSTDIKIHVRMSYTCWSLLARRHICNHRNFLDDFRFP